MKKQGFTLVELLAVIVILAVIAIITIPLIGDVIEKSKKGALEDSAYGIVEAANLYYTENIVEGIEEPIIFDFVKGEQTSTLKLEYKGKVEEGKVILNTNGKVVLCISDGKYYAYKNQEESKVTSGTGSCSYNGETGDFDIISDVDTLNAEIKSLKAEISTLKGQGNATSADILKDKTALVQGQLVTGTFDIEQIQKELTLVTLPYTPTKDTQAFAYSMTFAKANVNPSVKYTCAIYDQTAGTTIVSSTSETLGNITYNVGHVSAIVTLQAGHTYIEQCSGSGGVDNDLFFVTMQ